MISVSHSSSTIPKVCQNFLIQKTIDEKQQAFLSVWPKCLHFSEGNIQTESLQEVNSDAFRESRHLKLMTFENRQKQPQHKKRAFPSTYKMPVEKTKTF